MTKPTALGCYIFAGGFTIGVRKHFDVLAHFEEGSYGVETAAHNIPELRGKIFIEPTTWPVADYAGRVDFVYGNPPCAPWSVCSAGRRIPWRLDPRVGCAQRLYGLLAGIQPKVWAFESVRPTFSKGRELIDEMVVKAADLGYTATALMVEGTRHGVPQRRPRFFLVLSKYRINWQPSNYRGVPTVGDAFAKAFSSETVVDAGTPFFKKLIRDTKPGQRCAALFNDRYPERIEEAAQAGTKVRQRPSFQNIRLDATVPSCTLTGGAKQIHPTLDRLLSVEESAALCGYPRSFKFLGSVTKRYAQVAQAVMPPVGEYLARMVATAIAVKKPQPVKPEFTRVEIFNETVDVAPLSAQSSLPFDPDPPKKTIIIPAKSKEKTMTPNVSVKRFLKVDRANYPAFDVSMRAVLEHCTATGIAVKIEEARQGGWELIKVASAPVPAPKRAALPPPVVPAPKAIAKATVKTPAKAQPVTPPPASAKAPRKAPTPVSAPASATAKPRSGSGARIRELLQKGWEADRILETIHKEFPDSRATKSDVNWNRRKLETDGAEA
jgi:DNA (cytosine-5)-methyltransferase 1